MNDLIKSDNKLPTPIPDFGSSLALDTLQEALNAGVEIIRTRELGRTQREAILANKEVRIVQISEEIKRAMASDRMSHEERMMAIKYVGDMLIKRADALTSEEITVAKMLLETLRGN